jgi:hypothetical protein
VRIGNDVARELALLAPLEWSESDRALLAPLVDATLVWADDEVLRRIAAPIVAAMWSDDLRHDIERALDRASVRHTRLARKVDAAYADLAAGPEGSRLALAVVEQAAVELALEEQGLVYCLLCVHDQLVRAPAGDRRHLARTVARIATRAAAVPADEVRAAVSSAAVHGGDAALALATDERRRAVRAWLGRLAELGAESVGAHALELRALAAEPLPAAVDDEVWRETVAGLAERSAPGWN